MIPFTIAGEKKYFEYLIKETKDLYTENYKILLKEIKECKNKWNNICLQIGSVESAQQAGFLKAECGRRMRNKTQVFSER